MRRHESETGNRILVALSTQDRELLAPALQQVELPMRKRLETANHRIAYAYFIESGIASVVARSAELRIEVGLIGSEGFTGVGIMMGVEQAAHDTFMQVPGSAQRLTAEMLRQAVGKSTSLRRDLLRYTHGFWVQTAQTALANGRGKLEQRLARWLLMTHDRVEGEELPFTHEFVATMLGVRRAGVTVALHLLEKEALILCQRKVISVINRLGLEELAGSTYGVPEVAQRRMS